MQRDWFALDWPPLVQYPLGLFGTAASQRRRASYQSVFLVSGAAAQDGVQPESPSSIEAVVGATITYQGVLNESGSPVTGNRDMTFRFPAKSTGASALNTRLFTRGDTARGVRIISGTLRLNDGGGIRFN